MASETRTTGLKERLDDLIKIALSGKPVQLEIKLHESYIKQVSQSEATDDIDVETDRCLFMADFRATPAVRDIPEIVTKVYALCPINENEIDAKTTRRIANDRLKLDYIRLKEARIRFEEKYF